MRAIGLTSKKESKVSKTIELFIQWDKQGNIVRKGGAKDAQGVLSNDILQS